MELDLVSKLYEMPMSTQDTSSPAVPVNARAMPINGDQDSDCARNQCLKLTIIRCNSGSKRCIALIRSGVRNLISTMPSGSSTPPLALPSAYISTCMLDQASMQSTCQSHCHDDCAAKSAFSKIMSLQRCLRNWRHEWDLMSAASFLHLEISKGNFALQEV